MNEILKISNLSKTFGERGPKVNALNDLNLVIKSQSFTSIIGRSGSGKTTLLNIIGGLEPPTSGEIKIGDINPYKLNDNDRSKFRRRHIGYIFQFFNLLPELTVYENICLPSYLDHRYPDKCFIKKVLDKLALESMIHKYPAELSGGEQQRVAVARALSCKPEIILADEPTGNLDKRSGYELMDLLHYSCRMFNQTILLVTHDLEIARTADRIVTLEDGRIISDISGDAHEE
ncbi:ABC transporter ATP-binding protein [Parasporobacterium paucivorans]|uniref:Putative ABC transport system ATP-binding protein n=1 Tax=Parasporobacterium paucivorans DSM 15970 TaxID=1122934 RepID=A0A1M6KQ24_9FIRM|nr:ABC transporter ATP-binding protein [Parasporobacterium paucivorans]SHJ60995.1 putative ABC transport system ATP-binding protein [Parasporobacterium paucivorans DSM 15970]